MSDLVGRDRSGDKHDAVWQGLAGLEGRAGKPTRVGGTVAGLSGRGGWAFSGGHRSYAHGGSTSTWGTNLQWWSCPFCDT